MPESLSSSYLDAMGVDRYVSRYQLPGAAESRSLPSATVDQPGPEQLETAAGKPVPPPVATGGLSTRMGQINVPTGRGPRKSSPPRPLDEAAAVTPRFSIAAITAGDWLWLEDLGDMPLAREQVQLVHAMASALGRVTSSVPAVANPEIAQFDWPMHNNQQLDLGKAAAGMALTSFIERRLGDKLGLVLLGSGLADRVQVPKLKCRYLVLRHSSAELLAKPELKKQAWSELRAFPVSS